MFRALAMGTPMYMRSTESTLSTKASTLAWWEMVGGQLKSKDLLKVDLISKRPTRILWSLSSKSFIIFTFYESCQKYNTNILFLLPTSSETKLMDKSVFYQKVGPTLSQLTRPLSTQNWSATTIFHSQCSVKQRPPPISRSTLDPREWLQCFLVKEIYEFLK